jgi:hypothetical protein
MRGGIGRMTRRIDQMSPTIDEMRAGINGMSDEPPGLALHCTTAGVSAVSGVWHSLIAVVEAGGRR